VGYHPHAIKLRDSPYGEHFILEETPWLIAPAARCATARSRSRSDVLRAGRQNGLSACESHLGARAPAGRVMFVAQTIDAAKEQAKGRILPMIEGNPALAALLPQGEKGHDRSWKQTPFSERDAFDRAGQ
jgi:hypothetical protein